MNSQTLGRPLEHPPRVASAYQYWVLRYVPSVMRGEFVNVGVIVGSGDEWALRAIEDFSGRSHLGGDLGHCLEWVKRLQAEVDATRELEIPGAPRMSQVRLERLQTLYNNSVQIAHGGPVAAESAEDAAELMFGLMVGESQREHRQRSKTQVNRHFESVLDVWSRARTGRTYRKGPRLTIGRGSERFDFAISADEFALTHTWTFDKANRYSAQKDVKSWAHSVQRLRNEGARVTYGKSKQTTRVPSDVNVGVLVRPPQSNQLRDVYAEAEELWEELDISVYRESQEERMVGELTAVAMT